MAVQEQRSGNWDAELSRAVIDSTADGFWMVDLSGRILEVNDAFCRMCGFDAGDVVGRTIGDFDAVETPEQTAGRIAEIRSRGSVLFETRLRCRDDTVVPVEVSASYTPAQGGRILVFIRDVARRRRAEYILRARAEILDMERDAGLEEMLRGALDRAELLTGSSIGFFHLVDADQEHLALQTWSTNTVATMCSADGAGRHYPVAQAGVWTESIRTKRPAIHNDYAHMDGRRGLPEGHAPVVRELVVPVIRAGTVIALMGVGNKTSDYTQEDVAAVEALAHVAANVALHSRTQEEFERFFELVPDLVCIVSSDGHFVRVNGFWERQLGYPVPEMLERPFLDFVHPEDREVTERTFASEMCGDSVSAFVNRYLAKDGTYHWLEWSASPIVSEGLVFAVARDITETRARDEELARSESRFRGLFENMVEGLAYCRMVYDDAGRAIDWIYLDVNEAFEHQTGIVGAAGRRVSEVIPGIRESDPVLFERYSHVATTGEPTRFEQYVAALDMWFDLRVYSPQKGDFVAVFDVITDRKRTEAEAAEREARLQALLDNAPYGAHMYELTDDDRLVFIGYNAQAARMLGIDHDPLLGLTLEEAFPGNVGTQTPGAYRRVAREGGTWETTEYDYSDERGIDGAFEVYAFSFGPNRVSVFFRDVTELRRTELELQRSDRELRATVAQLADVVRTLRTLSACNEALVRAESEERLLQDVCDIAVEQGGYKMTWVGYAQQDPDRTVLPVACAGSGTEVLERIHVSWDPATPTGQGAMGHAIRTASPFVVDSVDADPNFTAWRDEMNEFGFRAAAAFPLTDPDGGAMGAILFYGEAGHHFAEGELAMLGELASDLSYGIRSNRARTARIETSRELSFANERLEGLLHQITTALGRVIEARDPYTSGHEERVSKLARAIAEELGLPESTADATEIAGLVHDIGKLSVPTEILTKPGNLSQIELELVRDHSRSGYEILKGIDFPWPIADIVLQHHERTDGSGYPAGLKGDEILLPARILAVADTVEAMASHRPYRPALGVDAAIEQLSSHGYQYDPAVVEACVRLLSQETVTFWT